MSHYHLAIIIPAEGDVKGHVDKILTPFNANLFEGDEHDGPYWDWYRIGGRWDGVVMGLPDCAICAGQGTDAISHHYSDAHEKPENNCVPIRELKEDFHCFSVLEPDGSYTCAYEPGEWGTKSQEEWLPQQDKAINRWLDYRIVSVDFNS